MECEGADRNPPRFAVSDYDDLARFAHIRKLLYKRACRLHLLLFFSLFTIYYYYIDKVLRALNIDSTNVKSTKHKYKKNSMLKLKRKLFGYEVKNSVRIQNLDMMPDH